MERRLLWVLGAVGAGLLMAPGRAGAQSAYTASPYTGVSGASSNPFGNPYMNPFLIGAMSGQQMTTGNAALYFFAAREAGGGIGTGRISGSRPGPGAAPAAPAAAKPRGTSNTPGGTASRYFDRNYPTTLGTIPQYNRPNRYFPGVAKAR